MGPFFRISYHLLGLANALLPHTAANPRHASLISRRAAEGSKEPSIPFASRRISDGYRCRGLKSFGCIIVTREFQARSTPRRALDIQALRRSVGGGARLVEGARLESLVFRLFSLRSAVVEIVSLDPRLEIPRGPWLRRQPRQLVLLVSCGA